MRSRYTDNLLVQKVGARMAFHADRPDLCVERYEDALALDPENAGLLQEYADTLILLEDADQALILLNQVLQLSPGNRKATLSKVRAFAALKDRSGCASTVEELAASPHWDKDSQPEAIGMLIECGAHMEANRRLVEIIREEPSNLLFLRLSIKNHTLAGNYSDAVRTADKVIRISDEGFDDHMVKADIQFQMGDSKGARRTLGNILRLEPHYLPALTLLKDVSKSEGDEVSVLELCDQILYLDPNDVGAMLDKAASLDRTGASVEATEMYCRALSTPDSGPIHLRDILSTVLSRGRYDDASMISDKFLEIHGEDWALWALRGNALYGIGRMEESIEAYDVALGLNGNDSLLWYSKAMALEQMGQLQDALDSYDKAIVRDLGNTEAWMGKALILERMGDLRESLRNLEQVLKNDPGHHFALIRKSRLLVRMGKLQEAVYFLDMATKLNRSDLVPLALRREVLKRMQDHNGVILSADDMLKQKDDDWEALMDKAKALQSLRQYSDSLKVLTRMQRLDPESMEVMSLRRNSLQQLGRQDEATQVLEEMIALQPEDKELLLELLNLRIEEGDQKDSLKILDHILTFDPLNLNANHAKAELLLESESYDEVLELLNSMREQGVWEPKSMGLMACAQLGAGNPQAALETAEEGLAEDKVLESLHVGRALALLSLNRPEDSLRAAEEGLKVNPQSPALWRRRADALMKSGDIVAALTAYDRAVGFGDTDPDTHFHRAQAQYRLDKPEMALSSLQRALSYRPRHAASWSLLGLIQTEAGEMRDARKSLDTALSISPDDRDALLRRARLHAAMGEPARAVGLFDSIGDRGLMDAKTLLEKAELLMSMNIPDRALLALEEAYLMDPDLPGLKAKIGDLEASLSKQRLLQAAQSILEESYQDGSEIDAGYIRSRAESALHEELEELLLSREGLRYPAVWSPEFEALEQQSQQILLILGRRDHSNLENSTLSQIYVHLPERDIRRAKEIHAHIRRALVDEIEDPEIISSRVHAVREMLSVRADIPSLYEVMRRQDLGPYSARLALFRDKEEEDFSSSSSPTS